ncbi:MAG TPA: branched-chain amino acid ABC transporter substrate-binding protein [Acetobacteraceae bacterium]|jgi:branched-chain amino acid transport system substrate-binding protein|nr:branched-chain amino acid ABC transporter substrate-binding protein [Acetobacteraceae bacterium]
MDALVPLLSRRTAIALGASFATTAALRHARAAGKTFRIALNLPFTGGEAEGATEIKNGVMLAVEAINAKGGVAGYMLEIVLMDDGTSTAGGYDPGQAATNARKMVTDPTILAALGPYNSGSGKAMSPILSAANLPIITPSSTNPDITDPKFAQIFRPAGPAIYFRTVTTDAFQGPYMANYYHDVLKVPSVFVIDDSGAYGVGIADTFQAQAAKKGINVLGRDRVDPKTADYTPVLTKIKSLNAASIYYGGSAEAGIKIVKQSYDVIPNVIKGGGDGVYEPEILIGGGFPAAEGWYATIAAPHLLDDPKSADWVKQYVARYKKQPNDYCITAYDAVLVIVDAIERVAASGKELKRPTIRDAIEATHLETLQGPISFDKNGDLKTRVISVFQIKRDTAYPPEDMAHQFRYIGVAPAGTAT